MVIPGILGTFSSWGLHLIRPDVPGTRPPTHTTSPVWIMPPEFLVMALLIALQSLHRAAEPSTLPSLSTMPFTNLSVPPPYSRRSTTGTARAENIFLSRNKLQFCRVSSEVSWLRFESSMGCCIHRQPCCPTSAPLPTASISVLWNVWLCEKQYRNTT